MISKEEFDQIILTEAEAYARDAVMNPEEHEDAVKMIIADFTEGANLAWEVLMTKE